MLNRFLILLILLFNGLSTYAYNRDSLLAVVESNKHSDSAKSRTYTILMMEALTTEKKMVDEWYRKGLLLAKQNKDLRMRAEMHKNYAEYHLFKHNDYGYAFKYLNLAISDFEKGHYYPELMYAYHTLARKVFERLNMVDEAIDAMKRCCYFAEKGRASELYFRLYELGWYETINEKPFEGFRHLHESYELCKENDPLKVELLIWMGNTFSRRRDYKTALTYMLKAARYADSAKAEGPKYDTYRYAAYCYRELGQTDTAIAYLKRASDFYIRNHDYDRIHFLGAELLNWYVRDKNLPEARKIANLLLDSSSFNYRSNREDLRSTVDLALYNYYYSIGDYKKSIYFLNDYRDNEDSLRSRNERLNLGELNLRMNFLKQREIQSLLQKQKDMEEESKRKAQNLKIWLLVGAVALSIILLMFTIRNARQRKAAYKEISAQKHEVEKQKQLVESKNKEMLDSMHYAKRIQRALLAHKEQLNEFIPDNFIYFKPKDIVSGDFYWTSKVSVVRDKFFLGVCDSTGHGVPGAFMSLLNIGFLSEAIKEKDIYDPNKVFEYVRTRLVSTISNDGHKDGFDGILICFDPAKMTLTYCAANNWGLYVSKDGASKLNFDRIPVGQSDSKKVFTMHTIAVEKGDVFFLYTDGYSDQFGGPKGKKFMSANLEKLLIANVHLSMNEQLNRLDKTFVDWKGNFDQIDDVCVVGFRI